MSREANHRGDVILLYILLTIIIFLLVFPPVYTVDGSSKFIEGFLLGGLKIFPETWRSKNYMKTRRQANFTRYTLGSVFFAVASAVGIIITSSMTGHAVSRCDFPGKELLIDTFSFMTFLIGTVTLFPIFQLRRKPGLLDSVWGMVIVQIAAAQPLCCILVVGYCNRISEEIDEAATINGTSFSKIYTTILVPIMKPILTTTGILTFRDTWSNYVVPLAFTLPRSELRSLTVGVVLLKD